MSDFRGTKEVARQLILDLKCSVCKDVPGFAGVRRNRYACPTGTENEDLTAENRESQILP